MSCDTKNRILDTALELFSTNGYTGTNIRDLSQALGLTKSAMYKHFKSKEHLWNTLKDQLTDYYFSNITSFNQSIETIEQFKQLSVDMINFTINDKKVIMIRKLIHIEQFRCADIKLLADKFFIYNMENIFENVFSSMMRAGVIKNVNPKLLAFSFTSPISTLIHQADRLPENKGEITNKIQSFINLFIDTYKTVK